MSFHEILRVMLQSRANSTTKTYLRTIRKFLEWCKSKMLSIQLPFPVSKLSLYLFELYQSCASSASLIIQAHAALKWFHSLVPSLDRNPLDSKFCRNIIESAKRVKSKPITKKMPFFSQIIRDIINVYSKEESNLKDLRVAALCSLAFAGFFRYNELCNILPSHIEFHSEYLRIFVPQSKTDVYREGKYVYISATGTRYCLVSVLRKYMVVAGIDVCSNLPLFRPLVYHRSSASYTLRGGKISYTSCREILRDTLKKLGFNPDDTGFIT